jgi:hypothetical protein
MAETFIVENIDYKTSSLVPRVPNGRPIGSPERTLHSVTVTLSLEWVDSPFDNEQTLRVLGLLGDMQREKACSVARKRDPSNV